jgi:hypothetical protein
MAATGLCRLHGADPSLENWPELGQHKLDSGAAQMIVIAIERMPRRIDQALRSVAEPPMG